MSPRVLASHFFEITIKDFVAARESGTVVVLRKRLDKPRAGLHHLIAEMLPVAARRFAKSRTGRRRI